MIYSANFKMNHTRASTAEYISELNRLIDSSDVIESEDRIFVFPPTTALLKSSKRVEVGVQNAYPSAKGAFTGEVGLLHLEEFGIKTVMIGHSERREILKESQDFIAEKFQFFKKHNFEIIYCIGEPLKVRKEGTNSVFKYLWSEFEGIDTEYERLIVAYEPIWAIGSGISATPSDIEEIHSGLRERVEAPLLYGGSVNSYNISQIKSISNVDGVLVGSASLKVESFFELINNG